MTNAKNSKVVKDVIEGEFVGKETPVKKTEVAIIEIEGLIKIPENEVVNAFSSNKKLNVFIKIIKKEVTSKKNDLSSDKGRKEIASRAHKVSKMKTAMNKVLDTSLEDAKSLIKKAGDGKKYLIVELDKLKSEVRQPLTDWENAEKEKEEKRIADIQELLKGISAIGALTGNETKTDISELIEAITGIDCAAGFDEYAQEAMQAKNEIKEKLANILNQMIQKELEDQQRKELAAKEAEIELQRKANELKEQAQKRLNNLMMIPVGFMGKSVFEIETKIKSLSGYVIEESQFGELYESAKQSVLTVITQLEAMATNQKLVEAARQQEAEQRVDKLLDVDSCPEVNKQQENEVYVDHSQQSQQINEPVNLKSEIEQLNNLTKNIVEENNQPLQKTTNVGYTTKQKSAPTTHELMMYDVKFWAKEYAIYGPVLNDLNNVLNKYK